MRTPRKLLGLLGLGLVLSLSACGKGGKGSRTPKPPAGAEGKPGAALDPTKASAEAKQAFQKVAEKYAAATKGGKLSAGQCESFANDFEAVYKKYGTQMTIAWFNAGAAYDECGQTDKAEAVYQAITQAVPKFDLAYNNLGVIYWNRNQEARALDFFKKAVEVNPQTVAPRNNLAASLRNKYIDSPQQSDFEAAERNIQTALALDSGNRFAYENLARLYYERGRLKDKSYLLLAELVVTQAMRILKEEHDLESADIFNIQGLLFMEKDNQVDALKAFKKAVELEPNHADANMNMAMISIRFRDYATAEKSLGIAMKDGRQKRNIETHIAMGVAKRGLRKYQEAEDAFKTAMKAKTADPRPLYNLGILYQEHIATAQEDFTKKPYEVAKDYFGKFASAAGGKKELASAVADAKSRVESIDQLFRDIDEMKKLEAEAKRLEEQAKKQEAEERKRLLDLEKKAREAAAKAAE
jgi:tetratricopeptide (TPR) repeat protein